MKYMVATDYDGTLFQAGGVGEKTKKAIDEFRKAGNIFGVVTGRDYIWSYGLYKREGLFGFDFVLSNNGAQGWTYDGDRLFCDYIENVNIDGMKLTERLVKRNFEQEGVQFGVIMTDKERFNFHPTLTDGGEDDGDSFSPHSLIPTYEKIVSATFVYKDVPTTTVAAEIIGREFGKYLTPLQNGRCLDITCAGTNKATGIAKIAKILGVDDGNIYTAGDNMNDIAMLQAYHGCAMTTGVDEAKACAEYVCDTVGDVIEMIMKF